MNYLVYSFNILTDKISIVFIGTRKECIDFNESYGNRFEVVSEAEYLAENSLTSL